MSSTAQADPLSTEGRTLDGNPASVGAESLSTSSHKGRPQTDEPHGPTQRASQMEGVHFENVSAAQDAQQVIVSTIHKAIYGRDLVVEARGSQLLGQIADPSVLQLSQNWVAVRLGVKEGEASKNTASFDHAYGAGHRLTRE
jgi:hypothetical protein